MIDHFAAAVGVPAFADPILVTLAFAIVIFATLVQSAIGMGFGLTSAPILALIDTAFVPGPTLALAAVTTGLTAVLDEGRPRWNEIGHCMTGLAAGTALAAAFLTMLPGDAAFSVVFGLVILTAVGLSLGGHTIAFTRINLIAMSAVAGVMGTITSVSAPPLAMIYQHHSARDARATLATFFSIGTVLLFAGAWISGWARPHDALVAASLFPGVLVGLVAARWLRRYLDQNFRHALLAVSGCAGALLVAKGLA